MKDLFDKNTLLGIGLILAMLYGYFYYSKSKFEADQKKQALDKKIAQPNTSSQVTDSSKSAVLTNSPKTVSAPTDTTPAVKGENITLSNELVSLNINTTGAGINTVVLAKHKSHKEKNVELLSENTTNFEFSIPTSSGIVSTKNKAFTVINKSAQSLEMQMSDGTKVSYTLSPNSYKLSQKWTTIAPKGSQGSLKLETSMNPQEVNLARERQYSTISYLKQNEEILSGLDKSKNEVIEEKNPLNWVSCNQQFFNVTIIPQNGFSTAMMKSDFAEKDTNYVKKYLINTTLAPQEGGIAIDYYLGPSDYKLLKKEDKNLDLIVPLSQDFILFRWMKIFNIYLIIPIFDFLSKFFSNYGIIILLLTLFIKLITAPLQYKQYKSGVAMKILKPQLDKLKEKFGDDQQKLSQEQMKLYGEYGVSPFGGCLPMLMQMPILFAMFNFFPSSIELRHQSFLWAHDLSTYDSILSLPFSFYDHVSLFALLSAATQIGMSVYAQRLQPSSPQADQMKMMTYFMPVVFLFLFNSFPAALTYYYFLQNILGMVQQWFFTTFIIKEDKLKLEMEEIKKSPKKQSGFQKKMQEMMEQAEQQKKLQQNQNKK